MLVRHLEGPTKQQLIEIHLEGPTMWVGRWRERASVHLDDRGKPCKASRLHARLELDSATQEWSVVDNESANGTFVNDQRVSSAALEVGEGDNGKDTDVDDVHAVYRAVVIITLALSHAVTPDAGAKVRELFA